MAFQKKYYYQFVPIDKSETHVVELWQDTVDVLVAEEVTGGVPPFVVELPDLNHKFQVVRGTGCTIKMLSDTDMKFYDGLEHTDPQEFKVYHYIDGVLNWCGYLNSEMYSETYDTDENYIITTTGNDGFSLMDRFRFIQADGTNYTGIKSKWELIQICLDKVDLPYTDIRVLLATTFSDFTAAADSTILHESYVNCSNFYDEDDKGMTLREVMESILAPYGAFIVQSGGSIYITDIHSLAGGGSLTYQKFNASTYAYISTEIVVTELAISSIGYFGTGQSIERSGGVNRQVVTYSPYPTKNIINQQIVTPDEFTTVPGTFSDKDGYKYRQLQGHSIWSDELLANYEESCKTLSDERFVYLQFVAGFTGNTILELIDTTAIQLSITGAKLGGEISSYSGRRGRRYLDGVALLITADVLAKVTTNPYVEFNSGSDLISGAQRVARLGLRYACTIGSYYYNASTDSWTTTPITNNFTYISKADGTQMGNQWMPLGVNGEGLLMKIGSPSAEIVLNGAFNFQIYSDTKLQIIGEEIQDNDPLLKEVWIRKLAISLVRFDGSEIQDNDIEYIGLLDPVFSEEGQQMTLTTGTSTVYSDKGKIMYNDGSDYYDILEWTRNGQTYKIEELLLSSICSNYDANFVTLKSMNLRNDLALINVLTDTFITGKIMMVEGASINYADNVFSCSLTEISEDALTVVK